MALTVFTTGTPFSIIFYLYGSKISGILLMIYILSFLMVFKLNKDGNHKISKIILLVLMNTAVIHYSIWYGVESGLHRMLVPFACVPFLIFSKKEMGFILFFVITSIIGFVVIETVDFEPLLSITTLANSIIYYGITIIFWTWIILEMLYLTNQNALAVDTLNKQKKEQTIAILNAQENERRRIARDLHDGFGQLLSALKINLEMIPNNGNTHLTKAFEIIDNSLIEVKNIAYNLMPITLEDKGLITALQELVDRIRHTKKFNFYFYVHNVNEKIIEKDTQYNIYRIVQEALNNIIKHSEATEVNFQLMLHNNKLTITIEDNGIGFNVGGQFNKGNGLQNIKARSELLDGTLNIDSGKNIGTTLIIVLPIKNSIYSIKH